MNFIKSLFHFIRILILTTLLILLVIFMVNNRTPLVVSLSPLPFTIETKMFMVMISFFVLGLFFGILLCSKNIVKRIFENFKARRKIKKLQQQLSS